MAVEYLQPIKGCDLEAACNDPVNAKLANYIKKHYVFADKVDFPKKPGKMATRRIWEDYEKKRNDVEKQKQLLHQRKADGIFTLYRQNTYVVSVSGLKYYILSGNNEKEPVSMLEVLRSGQPKKYAGRSVMEMPGNIYVPFFEGMYTLSMNTGYYKRID